MKPLILILLAAVFAQGQTLADVARRERARQTQVKSIKVFTSEDLKNKDSKSTAEAKPVENSAPAAPAAARPAAPTVDPVQQWTEETAKLRAHVRELMDQETATLLEINTASANLNAPITSQSAKNQAQKVLDAAQQRLVGVRAELGNARASLQEKDLIGPPQKK